MTHRCAAQIRTVSQREIMGWYHQGITEVSYSNARCVAVMNLRKRSQGDVTGIAKMTMDATMMRDHREVSQRILTRMPDNNRETCVCVLV
jgi:hypothetical protein